MYNRIAVLLFAVVALTSSTVLGQTVSKSSLSGTAFAASVSAASSGAATLYTAPAAGDGFAIITSVCGSLFSSSSNSHLSGSTLGLLGITTNGCISFPLGLPLPAGEVLTYFNSNTATSAVTIAGIVSKK